MSYRPFRMRLEVEEARPGSRVAEQIRRQSAVQRRHRPRVRRERAQDREAAGRRRGAGGARSNAPVD